MPSPWESPFQPTRHLVLEPPRTLTMREVTTQVSAPKSSTNWTTAIKKKPDTRVAAPSLLRIRVSLRHIDRALSRFWTTSGQLSFAAEITRPNYLKEFAISRGRTYALKSL